MADYTTREQWLNAATRRFRTIFETAGHTIPEKVRVSCGLPSVSAFGTRKRRIGEAWASTCSKDEHFEIFVSPTVDDPFEVLSVLAHELVHVTVGIDKGHKGEFTICAAHVGLVGPWTSTSAGDKLAERLKDMAERLGPYPHRSLEKMTNGRKKQTTRLVKVYCPACGYTLRGTMKWLLLGVPVCPIQDGCERAGETMEVDVPEEDKEHLDIMNK